MRGVRDSAGGASVSIARATEIEAIIDRVARWASGRRDIAGLLLVGSCAHDTAGPSSDVDFVLLTGRLRVERWRLRCSAAGVPRRRLITGQPQALVVWPLPWLTVPVPVTTVPAPQARTPGAYSVLPQWCPPLPAL